MNPSRDGWKFLAHMILLATACNCMPGGTTVPKEGVTNMPQAERAELEADLTVLREARVLFSHHSVGLNILAGVTRLDEELAGGRLRLVPLEHAGEPDAPALMHLSGGRNGDPRSKIDHFAGALQQEWRRRPDLAFMKFCYVDFEPGTDVAGLFAHYRRTLDALKPQFPEVRFAHVTVPLFAQPVDVRSRFRRLLGRQVWEDAANARRSEFNRLLREAYSGDPIFDLARVEATAPDGSLATFQLAGQTYLRLHPGYTDDGGHLNSTGQSAAGLAAVRFMADAIRGRIPRGKQ
jgi:hypothetical protein